MLTASNSGQGEITEEKSQVKTKALEKKKRRTERRQKREKEATAAAQRHQAKPSSNSWRNAEMSERQGKRGNSPISKKCTKTK